MTIDSQFQVPTVAMHTHVFERVLRSVCRFNGMPGMRYPFVPQPVMGKTPAQLRAYVDGIDPINQRPVMQLVVEGLTRPFGDDEVQKTAYERPTARADTRHLRWACAKSTGASMCATCCWGWTRSSSPFSCLIRLSPASSPNAAASTPSRNSPTGHTKRH